MANSHRAFAYEREGDTLIVSLKRDSLSTEESALEREIDTLHEELDKPEVTNLVVDIGPEPSALMGAATPQIAYTASKGGVLAMTRELAVVHARENIRLNALCPGPLHTELLMKFLDTDEKKQRRLVHIPAGRFGQAKEMAQAALFLASDESSYVTGTEFTVDGGITAAYVTPE